MKSHEHIYKKIDAIENFTLTMNIKVDEITVKVEELIKEKS